MAGRKLVERGLADEAIAVYATLLEETRQQYGDTSIETAPAYYEYGNSLLRAVAKNQRQQEEQDHQQQQHDDTETTKEEQRSAAAAAAENRQQSTKVSEENEETVKKPAAIGVRVSSKDDGDENEPDNDEKLEQKSQQDQEKSNRDNDEGDEDLNLALEMMENSFSILEEYQDKTREGLGSDKCSNQYVEWVKTQFPRILLGLGDTLSTLNRHADAADTYSRALELRKECLQEFEDRERSSGSKILTIEHLRAHRMVCDASILIAEALFLCPPGNDVVTTETQSLIVKADERVSYARGYYDQARDALQEAVVLMGSLSRNVDLGREKEDVCFLATLVMGVGETLAAIDEQATAAAASTEPSKKKAKRG